MAFFAAGVAHRERLMLAANRVGKTEGIGGYETTLHLTGRYPAWWQGHRFDRPISAWIAGRTNETTRDILQRKLFGLTLTEGGRKTLAGDALVPGEDIGEAGWKQGVPNLLDTVRVQHHGPDGRPDGWSICGLKSYQQGRGSFEGTEQDVIWLDEEPPLDVYGECLIRTMTTNGRLMLTFTPLEGMSEVVLLFLENGRMPGMDAE